VSLAKTLYMGG